MLKNNHSLLMIIACLSGSIPAANYFVNPTDSVEKIGNSAKPGDTVFFQQGNYHVTFTPTSGEQNRRITFKAVSGAQPVLDGSEKITSWQIYDTLNDIYTAQLTWGNDVYGKKKFPMMLFDNDSAMVRAQYPNQPNTYDPWDTSCYLDVDDGGELWLKDKELPRINLVGASLNLYHWAVIRDNYAVVTEYDTINNIVKTNGTYYDKTPLNYQPVSRWSTNSLRSTYGIYYYSFWNKLDLLDNPGEFFVDTNVSPIRVYIKPYHKGKVDKICAAKLVNAFDLSLSNNANFITIDGFIIRYYGTSNYRSQGIICMINSTKPQQGVWVRNNTIYNNIGAAVRMQGVTKSITIENNHFYHNGIINNEAYGICGGGDNLNLLGNRIHDQVMDGIYLNNGLYNSSLVNNVVYNCNSRFTHSDGVKIDALREVPDSNYILAGNIIYNCGQTLYFGSGHNNVLLANNLIFNSEADCIRFAGRDEAGMRSENIIIVNNTLIDYKINNTENNHGISLEWVSNYKIINNIIDGGNDWLVEARKNNLYVGLQWTQDPNRGWKLSDGEMVYLDFGSTFLDSDDDFRLQQTNRASDNGINLLQSTICDDIFKRIGVSKDILKKDCDGNVRPDTGSWDIGAFHCESCVGLKSSPKSVTNLRYKVN